MQVEEGFHTTEPLTGRSLVVPKGQGHGSKDVLRVGLRQLQRMIMQTSVHLFVVAPNCSGTTLYRLANVGLQIRCG